MIFDYFNNTNTQDIWFFTYIDNNLPVAIGYCVREKLTSGTYNLLAIGVTQNSHRKGIAKEMMNYIEQELKNKDGRILIVETSIDDVQIGVRKLVTQKKQSSETFGMTEKTKLFFGKSYNFTKIERPRYEGHQLIRVLR